MSEEELEVKEEPVVEETMETVMHDPNDPITTVKTLLEAGVHFGHPTRRWNPKMKPFIYTAKNNIYIIDLIKTKDYLEAAFKALKEIVANNGKVLFVGTKQQVAPIIEEEAVRSGSFYVNNRWLGGILTNFKTISLRIKKLKELELMEADGTLDLRTKKEAAALRKEKEKLLKNLAGIKEMRKAPNAIVIVDPSVEYNAVREANKLNIPVFALCDTNCDPDGINYLIPGNDDASKSVKLLVSILADAIVEAKGGIVTTAYVKQEGEDATMKDAIKQVERENAARLAAIREARRLKQEAYEKAMKEREAKFAARKGGKKPAAEAPAPEAPALEAPVTEEAPAAEENTETKGE